MVVVKSKCDVVARKCKANKHRVFDEHAAVTSCRQRVKLYATFSNSGVMLERVSRVGLAEIFNLTLLTNFN